MMSLLSLPAASHIRSLVYEFSSIDVETSFGSSASTDIFSLFDFSAKNDPVPTMLTQCHSDIINGFMGQTTSFHKKYIKKNQNLFQK